MQTSIVFGPNFVGGGGGGGGGAEVFEGNPAEESQALDNIMWSSNYVNNWFLSKMRISHHYL